MAPCDDPLLVAGDDMPAVRTARREERKKAALGPLDMRAAAVTRGDGLVVQRVGDGAGSLVKQGADRIAQTDRPRREIARRPFHRVHDGEVGVRRRRRMSRLTGAEEGPGRRRPRRKRLRGRLQRSARRFVLEPLRRQLSPNGRLGPSRSRPPGPMT